MNFKKLALTVLVLLVIDSLWLFTGGQYSVRMHEKIQGGPVVFRYGAAVVVYLAMAYMLNTFATSVGEAFALGLGTYAVYDFTNYALLKDYDVRFAIADSVWGGLLFSMAYSVIDYIGV